MVTYENLFAYTMVLISIIALVLDRIETGNVISANKKKLPRPTARNAEDGVISQSLRGGETA